MVKAYTARGAIVEGGRVPYLLKSGDVLSVDMNQLSLLPRKLRALQLNYQSPDFAHLPKPPSLTTTSEVEAEEAVEPTEREQTPIDHLTQPFESLEEVRNALQQAEKLFRAAGDRRSVFLTIYVEMTTAVIRGIETGAFQDPAWASTYLIEFANWYRKALLDFQQGNIDTVPQPWRLAFSASASGHTLIIQDLLLGVNAHINYDLAYTLYEIGIDPGRPKKLQDHNHINRILGSLVDTAQSIIFEMYATAGLADIDISLGQFDEWFTLFSLTEARHLAWRNATSLMDSQWRLRRQYTDWKINAFATGAAYFILAPNTDRSVLWHLRNIEGNTPPLDQVSAEFRRQIQ